MTKVSIRRRRAERRSSREPSLDYVFLTRIPERLRGLLFRKPDKTVRVLVPCRSVHTMGMAYEIDVAFLDAEGTVLSVHRKVAKRRRVRCDGARMTLERFATNDPWFHVGDRVGLLTLTKKTEERRKEDEDVPCVQDIAL